MKNKKLTVLLTMVFLSLSISACGSVDSGTEKSEEMTETSESSAEETEVSEEKAVTADKAVEATSAPTSTPESTTTSSSTQELVSTPASTAKPTLEPIVTPEPTQTPHVHQYTTETVTRQATCAEAGEKKLVCECGNSKVESIPVVDHNWEPVYQTVTHPSVGHVEQVSVQVGTSAGRTEYECAVCGHREDSPDALSEHRASFVGVDRTHATARTVAYDYPGEPIYEIQNQWVVDSPEYTTQELVGYTCSCGATK